MKYSFNPGSTVPEPDESLVSDPFLLLIETQGREILSRRYEYIANLLESDFEEAYAQLFRTAKLHYEIVNLVGLCGKTMKAFDFPRRPANVSLKKAIMTITKDYLLKNSL